MRFEWAVAARYVEVHDNLATIIGGGITTTAVPQLPAPIQVMICACLMGEVEEFAPGTEHEISCRVLDPQMQQIGDPLVSPFASPGAEAHPGWETNFILRLGQMWIAQEAGSYTIELRADERSFTIPMMVLERGAGPPSP